MTAPRDTTEDHRMRTVLVILDRPPGAVRDYVLHAVGPFDGSGPAHDYRREHGITNFEVVELREAVRVLDNVKLHEVSINTSGNIDPHAGQVWIDGELVAGLEAAPGFVADEGGGSDTVTQGE